jgi:hypothetical protein
VKSAITTDNTGTKARVHAQRRRTSAHRRRVGDTAARAELVTGAGVEIPRPGWAGDGALRALFPGGAGELCSLFNA